MQIQIYEIGVCLSESETRKLQEISEEIAQKDMLDRYKDRKSPPDVFSEKGVLKICRTFTGKHPCRSVTSIKFSFSLEHVWRAACVKKS